MKRFGFILFTMVLVVSLIGCEKNQGDSQKASTKKISAFKSKIVQTTSKDASTTVENDDKINLNKLNITAPPRLTKKGDENQVLFQDENKQTVGGISIVGYYGDCASTLPNHSELLEPSQDINTNLGNGKIFTLKRSDTAASGTNKTWIETHAIIPSKGKNLAYDIWANGKKDIVLSILRGIN